MLKGHIRSNIVIFSYLNDIGVRGFPFPHVKAHLHDESLIKWGTAEGCAGTFGTLGCKHYHECLCPCY